MSNTQGIFQAFIPQNEITNKQTKSYQVVTQRLDSSRNQENNQYQLGNEQPSFAADINEVKTISSPHNVRVNQGTSALNSNQQKIHSTQSNMTTYHNSSLSPAPTKTYQFNSSAYQSPQHHITAFNVNSGGFNSQGVNKTRSFTTLGQNKTDINVDSTSQVQQQLYKTLVNNETGIIQNGNRNYEYRRVISSSGQKRMYNDGSVSPVNLLSGDVNNGVQQRFFSGYSGQQPRVNNQTNSILTANGANIQGIQNISYSTSLYEPIRSTAPIATTSNYQVPSNGVKQSFQSHSFNYKPASVNRVTFNPSQNNITSGNVYGYNTASSAYNYGTSLAHYNQPQTSKYTTQTITTVNQSAIPTPIYTNQNYQTTYHAQNIIIPQQPIYQSTYQQNQQSFNHSNNQQSANLQTRIQNKAQLYQAIDEIERPKYQKLYGLQDDHGRIVVEQDPPTKKGFCGPLCWLPLVILGAVLALFGMLCGLGIVCPGGGSLSTTGAGIEQVFIDPSIVLNTTVPSIATPTIIPSVIQPQTTTPSTLPPQQLPSFTTGTPTSHPVTPSYVPPISIAPSANPLQPIVVTTSTPNLTIIKQFNASLPATPQPVIQIQPEVIKYDGNMDEYAIDATPHIVGVATNVNTEVVNASVISGQGVSSYIDYTTSISKVNKSETDVIPQAAIAQVANVSTVNLKNASIQIPTGQITIVPSLQVIPTVNKTQITTAAPVDDGWINPFAQTTITNNISPNTNADTFFAAPSSEVTLTSTTDQSQASLVPMTVSTNGSSITTETTVRGSQVAVDNTSIFGPQIAGVRSSQISAAQIVDGNTTRKESNVSNGYITTVEQVMVNTNASTNNVISNSVISPAQSQSTTLNTVITSPTTVDDSNADYIQLQPSIQPSSSVSVSTIPQTTSSTNTIGDALNTLTNTTFPKVTVPTTSVTATSTTSENGSVSSSTATQLNTIDIKPQLHIQPELISKTTITSPVESSVNTNGSTITSSTTLPTTAPQNITQPTINNTTNDALASTSLNTPTKITTIYPPPPQISSPEWADLQPMLETSTNNSNSTIANTNNSLTTPQVNTSTSINNSTSRSIITPTTQPSSSVTPSQSIQSDSFEMDAFTAPTQNLTEITTSDNIADNTSVPLTSVNQSTTNPTSNASTAPLLTLEDIEPSMDQIQPAII